MPVYNCTVTDTLGKTQKLKKKGSNKTEILRSFSGTDYIPVKITELTKIPKFIGKQKQKTVLAFTKMMDMLTQSGMPVKDSLEMITVIGEKTGTGSLAEELFSDIGKGVSFADAVNAHPELFGPVYRGIIAIGDRVGSVKEIFCRLSSYLENGQKIKQKISGALVYPIMVLFVAGFGIAGLIFFILPKMETMFAGFGGTAAELLQHNIQNLKTGTVVFAAIVFLIIAMLVILHVMHKQKNRKTILFDSIILRIPILGSAISAWQTLNFAFAMETLTAGGISIENAITQSSLVISNNAYLQALEEIHSEVEKGIPLSLAFSQKQEIPKYVSQWLAVGERTGNTTNVFSQIRSYFQNEIERLSSKYMTLIEPALILLIGVFLLVLVLTVIVPIFSLYGTIL